jgi:hypothetical protein
MKRYVVQAWRFTQRIIAYLCKSVFIPRGHKFRLSRQAAQLSFIRGSAAFSKFMLASIDLFLTETEVKVFQSFHAVLVIQLKVIP